MPPNWPFQYDSAALTGETTDAYAVVLDWVTKLLRERTITLTNTDGANGLKYKVEAYAAHDGEAVEVIAETTLAAKGQDILHFTKAWVRLVVSVKAAVGSAQADYALDYVGQV